MPLNDLTSDQTTHPALSILPHPQLRASHSLHLSPTVNRFWRPLQEDWKQIDTTETYPVQVIHAFPHIHAHERRLVGGATGGRAHCNGWNEINGTINQSIKCIYKALFTSADVTKCCTATLPKTPNSKQCRCRSIVARKNSLERPEPRKKPREEPSSERWPVLF